MSKEIKKIGHNIDLKGLVIHQAIKEAGVRKVKLKEAKKAIEVTDKEKVFIGKVIKSYYQKSSPIYGIFGNDNPTFKNHLANYLTKKDFHNYSKDALLHYKSQLEGSTASSGGFVIFADFTNTENSNDYMLVLTINNKDGFVVSEFDLSLKDIKNLDLSKVDVACLINLTKWKNIEAGVDKDSKTYLSFVKGNKDVSYYFMKFIDCNNKTTSSESTQKLIDALNAYSIEKGYDRDTRIKKINEISKYCEGCISLRKEIQLSTISALLDAENPEDFQTFAAVEKYGVSSIISGDKNKLKTMKFVSYKWDKIAIEFDSNLLGKDVVYNSTKKELTFKNLPEELIKQIPI
jgi:nucleoid-associated protein YejK